MSLGEELLDQLQALPAFVTACGFVNAKAAGYEADDFLAAAVAEEERRLRDGVCCERRSRCLSARLHHLWSFFILFKGGEIARIGPAEVRERYGVDVNQVPDFIALRGDPSDKLPGAHGAWVRRAPRLLLPGRYGTLEQAIAEGSLFSLSGRIKLKLYKKLATMDPAAPLPSLPDQSPTWGNAAVLVRRWELSRLADRLDGLAASGATRILMR